jgi:aryl-alcohol dehydrogenase-like predicted oxidoreductase
MSKDITGGTVELAADLRLTRMGYGTMRLAGPEAWGPPADRDAAIAVLRAAVDLGLNHLDTADFYGPHVTNDLIREALHPYPADLRIVTKVGARRTSESGFTTALTRAELIEDVHDNLDRLGVEALDVVNLRMSSGSVTSLAEDVTEPFGVLAELRQQGLIKHLGLSTVSAEQLAQAQAIAPVVCLQNLYNLALRSDDALVDLCAEQGIGYVPYFPLGGFSPVQSSVLDDVAARLGATPLQVALAWLLQRSPTMLLIPGTSSIEHLRENVAAATLELPPDAVKELDAIGPSV